MPWVTRYAPSSVDTSIQPSAGRVKFYVEEFKTLKKKKGLLLYGPPGSGKSSTVYAAAKESKLEIIETNASDFRTRDTIAKGIGQAMFQQSLFFKGKIILVDEVDGLSGTKDRGGIPEMASLIERSPFPVILTANDPFHKKFAPLRKKCVLVEFASLNMNSITSVLKMIADAEGLQYDDGILRSLARRCGGDLRAAINDMQSIIVGKTISKEFIDTIDERSQQEDIQHALMKIFKTTNVSVALQSLDHVAEDYDTVTLWIEYNLPREYTDKEALAKAYDRLSRAQVFNGRIRRRQHWRFLVYIKALLTVGIALAKKEKNPSMILYERTTRILKLWQANMKYQKRKAIAEKIADKTHCSTRKVRLEILPYVQRMVKQGKKLDLELDEGEVEWLKR